MTADGIVPEYPVNNSSKYHKISSSYHLGSRGNGETGKRKMGNIAVSYCGPFSRSRGRRVTVGLHKANGPVWAEAVLRQ